MLSQPKTAATRPLFESDGDDDAPPMRARSKHPSRLDSVLWQKSRVTNKKPLFLDSDNEKNFDEANPMGVDPTGEGVDEEQTLQSSFESRQTAGRRSTRQAKSRKPAPIIVDDDSDDDAVFKGFRGQKKGR